MAWAKEIYVATTACGVFYTNNFVEPTTQPTWQRVNNGLPTLVGGEFHLDPFHQSERQYLLTGGRYSTAHNGLFRRFMGEDWEEILSNEEFASIFTDEAISIVLISGFCTDPLIDGRLWVLGRLDYRDSHDYGMFGWGPYAEERAAYSDDYGDTWHGVSTWWTGWSVAHPQSIRSYGSTIYLRESGGFGDSPYITYSYNMGLGFNWVITDIVAYTIGGFFNPLTPDRFYYDTYNAYNEFRYFESGVLSPPMYGFWLGNSQWDTMWYNEDEIGHMRLINQNKIWTTYDGWASYPTSSPTINMGVSNYKMPVSFSPYAGDNSDYMMLGITHQGWGPDNPIIGTLYGESDIDITNISGTNWNTPPYTNSIPSNNTPCRCGIQGVHKLKGYVYVNAVAMPEFSSNTGGGVPMEGDRSVWNARYYARRHANDINSGSTTSIHHTLSTHFVNKTTGSYRAAPGDHSHYLRDMDSGSSIAGEILTSLGSGSTTWHTLSDHIHAGSAVGDGGRFNADHLSSGSQPINVSLTYDSEIIWKPINDWRLSLIESTVMNSSDKVFVAPVNSELQILWIWVEFSSTGTVGSRQIEIQLQDTDDTVINQWQAGITQNGNLTYRYMFGMVVPDLTALRDNNCLMTPIGSSTFLSAGQKIRIWDNKNIDSSNDDMIVRLQYSYHNV